MTRRDQGGPRPPRSVDIARSSTSATTHVVTVCSWHRRDHVLRQIDGVRRWMPAAQHHTVLIGEKAFDVPGSRVVDRTRSGPLDLARARNIAGDTAAEAGAEIIVFLDADCVPGAGLGRLYESVITGRREDVVHGEHAVATTGAGTPDSARPARRGVYCGPVTYLSRNAPALVAEDAWERLPELTDAHRARPNPPENSLRVAARDEYALFWSLSFAVSSIQWRQLRQSFGGFCERYSGYGGEDTDFAMNLAHHSIPLFWVGGAHAYHQWHAVSSPPVEHLEDIVANAGVFFDRWGWWPMTGWLEEFRERGLAHHDGRRWVPGPPAPRRGTR